MDKENKKEIFVQLNKDQLESISEAVDAMAESEKQEIQKLIASRIESQQGREVIKLSEAELKLLDESTNAFFKSVFDTHKKYNQITLNQYYYIHDYLQSAKSGSQFNLKSPELDQYILKLTDEKRLHHGYGIVYEADIHNYYYFEFIFNGSLRKTQIVKAKILAINFINKNETAEVWVKLFLNDADFPDLTNPKLVNIIHERLDFYNYKHDDLSYEARMQKARELYFKLSKKNIDQELSKTLSPPYNFEHYKMALIGLIYSSPKFEPYIRQILREEIYAILRVYVEKGNLVRFNKLEDIKQLFNQEVQLSIYNANGFADSSSLWRSLVKGAGFISVGYSYKVAYEGVHFPTASLTKANNPF